MGLGRHNIYFFFQSATETLHLQLSTIEYNVHADSIDGFFFTVGISMLTFALFASAYMGIYQEQVYGKYGKHPGEALFYNVSSINCTVIHLTICQNETKLENLLHLFALEIILSFPISRHHRDS